MWAWGCWAIGSILLYVVGIKINHKLALKQQIYEDSPKSHQKKQTMMQMDHSN